jgi:predicted nuclease of predicted toxin-antitoxin system
MRFIVDAQLPPALVRWLSAKGHVADHVGDLRMGAASDREIWNLALRIPAIIVERFSLDGAAHRLLRGVSAVGSRR